MLLGPLCQLVQPRKLCGDIELQQVSRVRKFPVQNEIAQLAGSWHVDMADIITRSVNPSISQSGDVLFGTGSMISANIVQEVAAYGSIAEGKLNLELLTMT